MFDGTPKARPSTDQYFLLLAHTVSFRATCLHRHQGAILVRDRCCISAGYNGSPPGQPHCVDVGLCAKEEGFTCKAEGLHGESNAIIFAARAGISTRGCTMYSVYSPCLVCCNIIATAGIERVVFAELYPNVEKGPETLKDLGVEVSRTLWISTDS